ncbi:GNAT family N-acetyltransferase [Mucilaginibacter calamicampi]|uniref:GNAT family N-acetyltransferase n=1 Tax=Mucilaginibacter calamicampi TaxID=1302352 RepID=A0ABW2YWD3_9SPHI
MAAASNIDAVLNNPVWHALNSGNHHLGQGNERVKYFNGEVSPFVALRESTDQNFMELYHMLAGTPISLFATPIQLNIPAPWKIVACVHGLQMIHNTIPVKNDHTHSVSTLLTSHCTEMVNLAKLTNPGPFGMRTIDFGHYQGVFDNNKLVAMAGQRMHAFNYAEISAVCTHPEYTGKGYARQLVTNQINRILAASDIPYLHVKHDNKRAVDLYQSLGFSVRGNMYFYILKK